MSLPAWLVLSLVLTDWTVRIVLIVRIIMKRKPVATTLAWVIMLALTPVVGIVLYALIGEQRLGIVRLVNHQKIVTDLTSRAAKFWHGGSQDWTDECIPYKPVATLATHVGLVPPLRGNDLELIANCDTFRQRIIDDIDQAASHVHLLTYIWQQGTAGEGIADAMIRATKRGVMCRVLLDGVGSRPFLKSELCRRMRRAGVRIVTSLPVNPLRALAARVDLRNHRKIVVIDGRIAYTGSHNITDLSFKHNPRTGVGPWVDASVRVVGPAAQALEVVFLHDWLLDAPKTTTALEALLPDLELPEEGSIVHVVPSMPGRDVNAIREASNAAIYMAREELIMTTPYFVPDETMRSALRAACLRGVRVELVFPAINDSPLVSAASRAAYDELLASGANIHHFNGGLLHSKTMTIDRHIGLIGSANFDARSFALNFEISLFVYDSDFASQLRFLQKHYIQNSTPVNAAQWARRSRLRRFRDNLARLAGPLL